mmetsp:Transcript_5112/g.17795  ORF Transcript_5112/g.17795 Transcript_5112/m.17795 type:complete len:238 (+) Transcript_5112:1057-1770(+)
MLLQSGRRLPLRPREDVYVLAEASDDGAILGHRGGGVPASRRRPREHHDPHLRPRHHYEQRLRLIVPQYPEERAPEPRRLDRGEEAPDQQRERLLNRHGPAQATRSRYGIGRRRRERGGPGLCGGIRVGRRRTYRQLRLRRLRLRERLRERFRQRRGGGEEAEKEGEEGEEAPRLAQGEAQGEEGEDGGRGAQEEEAQEEEGPERAEARHHCVHDLLECYPRKGEGGQPGHRLHGDC